MAQPEVFEFFLMLTIPLLNWKHHQKSSLKMYPLMLGIYKINFLVSVLEHDSLKKKKINNNNNIKTKKQNKTKHGEYFNVSLGSFIHK
jgi:hypothetical protein